MKGAPDERGATGSLRTIDVGRLERDLADAVDGEVRVDQGTRALYSHDSSNFRQVPIGVVIPRTLDDVVAVHRICHRFGAPILNRRWGYQPVRGER